MKKLIICVIIVTFMLISSSGIYAVSEVSLLDVGYTDNIYKFSDDNEINLPFIRVSGERMIIDRDILKSGISFARDNINVLNNLKGIQVLSSSDTIRVNGNMEYGIIMAPTVIIEGTIDKTLMVIAENLTVSEDSVIKEDLLCSVSKLDLLGNIEGNLIGLIDQANILGNINQDFRADVNEINLGENSKIQGSIYLMSTNNIDISDKYPNATIKIIEKTNNVNNMDLGNILRTSLIITLICILITSKTNIIKNALIKVKEYRISTVMYGIASILVLPLIIIIFFVLTLIGLGIITIPTMIAYSSFMIISCILSTAIVGSMISEYILNKYENKVNGIWYKSIVMFCTIFVLNIIANLPSIGYTMSVALCILSSGILFTAIFRRTKIKE
jgi:hypothetical protein